MYNKKCPNESMLEVIKFIAQKSSNVHNDGILEVSENTLIPNQFMKSKIPQYWFFSIIKIPQFLFFNGNRNSTKIL